jgi:hypothetical protein
MPAQQETKPVEDTVPKVDNDIAVGSDLEFQRGWWRFERIAWIALSLLLAGDLAGVFGRGPLAKAKVQSPDSGMTIRYERIERFSTPSILTVQIAQSAIHDGKFQLWSSETLVKGLGNQRVIPQPTDSVLQDGGILYTFRATDVPASVEFQLQPASPGVDHLQFRIPGGGEVRPTVYVLP